MKKSTHIYLAAKAIELMKESISNTVDTKGKYLEGTKMGIERVAAGELQEMLRYYEHHITQATWAPDKVLMDQDPYHIFKLYTEDEYDLKKWKKKIKDKDKLEHDGVTYYRFSGGLPYRIDHIAQDIISMSKLREHNDRFSYEQIMYQYLLMSHYIVDAHVPVHCDIRANPPKKNDGRNKPKGKYMTKSAHDNLEELWNRVVEPVAIKKKIITRTLAEEGGKKAKHVETKDVTFELEDCNKQGKVIKVVTIRKGKLMDFVIGVCIKSKQRSQKLFPVDNPKKRNDAVLGEMTRKIFADCISNLIAIWRYMWAYGHMQ